MRAQLTNFGGLARRQLAEEVGVLMSLIAGPGLIRAERIGKSILLRSVAVSAIPSERWIGNGDTHVPEPWYPSLKILEADVENGCAGGGNARRDDAGKIRAVPYK